MFIMSDKVRVEAGRVDAGRVMELVNRTQPT